MFNFYFCAYVARFFEFILDFLIMAELY